MLGMIVDCAHYRDGRRQHEGKMEPRDAAAICRYEEGFVWLGMVDPACVVLRTARYVDEREEVEFGEISIFVGPGFVITVRQGTASDLHPARLRLEARPELLREGPASVLWAVADQVVDDYAPVVEGLERDIE